MDDKKLRIIQLHNTIENFVGFSDIPEVEKKTFLEGINNLNESQLLKLLIVIKKNPQALKVLAEQAYKKKIILDKKDKKAWSELLQKEGGDLSKKLLEIMDDEINQENEQALDKIRKEL